MLKRGCLVAVTSLLVLSGCGSDQVPAPDVVGIRLDEAHRKLDAAGFETHSDVDAFGDRSALRDANWVVVGQEPAAGSPVDPGENVTLKFAKPKDKGTRALLPDDSPVLAELKKDDVEKKAEAEAQSKQDEAESKKQAQAIVEYAEELDPAARLGRTTIKTLEQLGQGVEDNEVLIGDLASLGLAIDTSVDNFNAYEQFLGALKSPAGRGKYESRLNESLDKFVRAAQTLSSATGSDRLSSVKRFKSVYREAVTAYDAALKKIYEGTDLSAPTVNGN